MRILSFVLLVLYTVMVWGQTDLVQDPGLVSLESNQCGSSNPWHFRSDFLFNDTANFFDSQCQASLELPTAAVPGLTQGRQTNVNKALIPDLPTVQGATQFTKSAGVVDMNTPCRAALWVPFTLENNTATVSVNLKIWVRSNSGITQILASSSQIPDADLLQYLREPNGLLTQDNSAFPPVREETNQVRIDIINPDENGGFYDRAFSLIDEHIAVNIPIPGFTGTATPASGTNSQWISVSADISDAVPTAGTYALRVASAQSRVGVSWGISDVHVVTEGGTPPDNVVPEPVIYDVVIENTQKTIGGTAVFSKISNIL